MNLRPGSWLNALFLQKTNPSEGLPLKRGQNEKIVLEIGIVKAKAKIDGIYTGFDPNTGTFQLSLLSETH